MRVEIEEQERLYDGFFKLDRITLRHERFDGSMSSSKSILNLERGDAVGVLLHDVERDVLIFANQFRYAAYERTGQGWMVGIIAGMMEEGESMEQVARREALEEAGYRLEELEFITTFFVSPGGTTERIHLFYAPVSESQRISDGGGIDDEDIRLIELSFNEAWKRVEDGHICDAKTIVALQWLRSP
ncbi:MAG: NUDIX domain-containing protein [Chloroflexota bacterium]|nr:NUDIX domain-containing protein [Chloroflexota bacterium]